jgi:hypothetical protein
MKNDMADGPFDSLDRYRLAIERTLNAAHGCPDSDARSLLDAYADVVEACFHGGVTVLSPVQLLYAAWRTQSAG